MCAWYDIHTHTFKGNVNTVLTSQKTSDLNKLLYSLECPNRLPETCPLIMFTILIGDYRLTENLLKSGADVNLSTETNNTPLLFAIEHDMNNIVDLLIKYGADIHHMTSNGVTAIGIACINNNINIAKKLIDLGVDTNIADDEGNTPFHIAIEGNAGVDLLNLLYVNNAKIDIQNIYGQTPLMIALEKGNVEVVKFLVDLGADLNLRDDDGKTALDLVIKYEDKKMIDLLITHGAQNMSLEYRDVNYPLEIKDQKLLRRLAIDYYTNLDMFNYEDKTSLDMAMENNDVEAIKIFERVLNSTND